jgi:hypothetical protein
MRGFDRTMSSTKGDTSQHGKPASGRLTGGDVCAQALALTSTLIPGGEATLLLSRP